MRIVYIAAGAAGTHCGACNRDVALVRELRTRGHDVTLLPVYTPLRVEGPDPTLRSRVFLGGISAYLQQHVALFRRTPAMLDRLWDSPRLLRWLARRAVSIDPHKLGPMTVSVLQGRDGRQRKELDKLVAFLREGPRPEVVNLTNSLLSGLAPALREALKAHVVCTLQGEEAFVRDLGEPYSTQALGLIRRNAEAIDLFLSPGEAYARMMAAWLSVPPARVQVVHPGLDPRPYAGPGPRPRHPFRVAFLSRIVPDKGLDILMRAFIRVVRERPVEVVLSVAGERRPGSARYWQRIRSMARAAGVLDRLEDAGSPDLAGKVAFLRRASVFVLPTRIEERRALACLEAMAAAVPVIVPRRGLLPEIIELTGGGLLVEPDDPAAVAAAIVRLIDDPALAERLGASGRAGVEVHFSARAMADQTLAAYGRLGLGRVAPAASPGAAGGGTT